MRTYRSIQFVALAVTLVICVAEAASAAATHARKSSAAATTEQRAAPAGKGPHVNIPKDFKYAGQVHPRGAYAVRIESGSEGSYVVVVGKDGVDVAKELAIVQAGKGKAPGTRTLVQLLSKDEHMVRLVIREGDKTYLAYFETTT